MPKKPHFFISYDVMLEYICDKLHIVKDVMDEMKLSIHPSNHSSHHPSMDGIIQARKPWQK
jgi:hypothetical protein